MKTLTFGNNIELDKATSYTQTFSNLFGISNNINQETLDLQKKYFGFTIYLLNKQDLSNAINLGIDKCRDIIETQKSILQIPHTSIFGGLFLGTILALFKLTFLFLPIVLLLLYFFSVRKIFAVIGEKIELFKRTRVFFNIGLDEANKIHEEYFTTKPLEKKTQIWKGKKLNKLSTKIFLFLFSQPFIFGHLHFFGQVPFKILFIFDFILFLILFGLFEKVLILFAKIYYHIYFNLLDKYPSIFSKDDQKYDFFYDLYTAGTKTINDINELENGINDFKKGVIHKDLGIHLSSSVISISNILEIIKKNEGFLADNITFKKFLKNLVNEIIDKYITIFDFLSEKLVDIKKSNDVSSLDNGYKVFFNTIIDGNIENTEKNLIELRDKLLKMKII